MNLSNLWNLAVAEMRSCRRLVRTWVIIAIGALVAIGTWLASAGIHAFTSVQGTEVPGGLLSPRFMTVILGGQIVTIFSLGILFLAFDIRSRDIRSRMLEVLDNRPISNVELLTGRLMGIVLLIGMAATVTVLTIVGIALLLLVSGVAIGHPVDPVSLAAFLIWDIVPNLAFVGSLTILLAILVRFRILVVLIVLVAIFGGSFVSLNLPVFLQPALTSYVFVNITPSELAPQLVNSEVLLNRMSLMLLTAAFLALAASIHPRRSATKNRQITGLAGVAILVAGALTVTGMIYAIFNEVQKASDWAAVHASSHGDHPTDVKSISGSVEIFPGRRINLDLVLNLQSTQDSDTDTWMFSLNPGYRIHEVAIDGVSTQDYSFEDGLLKISKPETSGSDVELAIVARGVPNPRFAYLDGSLDWRDFTAQQIQQLNSLGTESYIFHPSYVALLPGATWLPISGTTYRRGLYEVSKSDFFELDLEVSVPPNWTVVGPGQRTPISHDRRARFRFNPQTPISEVALLASKFERRATEVGGIEFEFFINKKHGKVFETLGGAAPAIEGWLDEQLSGLSDSGVEYPFRTYSMVEVPSSLRVYGGGWRMDSVLAPPSILMIRENGLPIARFDNSASGIDPQDMTEEDYSQQIFVLALRFFESNLKGESPYLHFSRNLVSYQTRPVGRGATALDFVVNELANNTWTSDKGYFSVYTYADVVQIAGAQAASQFGINVRTELAKRHSVWQRTLSTSLADLSFFEDSYKAMHVLHLRTTAFVGTVTELYEKESIGAFLRLLVERYRGKTYTRDQFMQTALDAGLDFTHAGGNWLDSRRLPGFFAASPQLERLADTESGDPVYQSTFILRNNEPIPGIATVSYFKAEGDESQGLHYETIWVPPNTSLRVATHTGEKPNRISINPNIAMNRNFIQLSLETEGDLEPTDSPELPLTEKIDWAWPYEDEIVVDDLDPGFSIVHDGDLEIAPEIPWIARFFLAQAIDLDRAAELDQGLPADGFLSALASGVWFRNSGTKGFGKYRQTYAVKSDGASESKAKFSVSLPSVGRWELRFHVPEATRTDASVQVDLSVGGSSVEIESNTETSTEVVEGVLKLQVEFGDKTENVELELAGTSMSWQSLGVFDIDTPEVDVLVLDATKGRAFADAIHWVRAEEN